MIARKKWSQVFINSDWVFKKLLISGGREIAFLKVVCEVGAGAGALSKFFLCCSVLKLVLIEIDARFISVCLRFLRVCPGKLDLIFRDAVRVKYLLFVFGARLDLFVSSLPYNVAARLLMLLSQAECVMLIVFQREMYYRILSNYSKLSLGFMHCNVRKLFDVPFFRFLPKPSVNSVCVLIAPACWSRSGVVCKLIGVLRRLGSVYVEG
ncbi:Ribosomal RNA small subunit methyltransferase A [Candidatus Hodgkinia cicadicola]|nr:Ribosomal RNA small subunit methyltransferase A [Candidatus Hodgkinia cicadicola]